MVDYAKILQPVDRAFCDERNKAVSDRMDLCIRTVNIRLEGMDRALELKTADLERRLAMLNELRSEVVTDRALFLTTETYKDKIAIYDKWVAETSEKVTKMETRYEGRITITTVLAILSIVVALASMVVPWVAHKP